METAKNKTKLKTLWDSHGELLIFLLLLAIFLFYAAYIALNLKGGIIPDGTVHYNLSKHFATTLGIPEDNVRAIYVKGVYIKQNPFLYYWINGRVINVFKHLFKPQNEAPIWYALRLLSVLYAAGTVSFAYLLSKEFIEQKWWRLLPVFLLTNTLMFVFLSGGINYDNLVNLLCMAGLYFLARVFNRKAFLPNSLAWMISIALGTLTKYTVLPLALAMGIAWFIFLIKNWKTVLPIKVRGWPQWALLTLFALLAAGNLAIYGVNLITHQAILPPCESILTEAQCDLSVFEVREDTLGLDEKLTLSESIQQGYPGPIRYFFTLWLPTLIMRIYGILGFRTYYPQMVQIAHLVLFYSILLIAILYYRDFNIKTLSFLGILVFYGLTLFLKNYDFELTFGFRTIALQGRYIFPVINIAYIILTRILLSIPRKRIRIPILFAVLGLYFATGPLTFILRYNSIFADWFKP